MYGNGRYEVECKYTQFVRVHSRPVAARLDMGRLAAALNRADPGRAPGTSWSSPRLVDTGPLLRLDTAGRLSKAQRYGHPTARPMHASGLLPAQFAAAVASYFEFGTHGVEPRVGGWGWEDLHALNAAVDWGAWEAEELPRALRETIPSLRDLVSRLSV